MEEIKGILTTSTIFNGTCNEYEGVRIKKELGVAVAFARSKPTLYEIQSVSC